MSNRTNKPPADNKSIIVEEIIYIKREIERDRASTTTTRRERERAKKNNANEARRNWTSPCGTFLMLITRRLLPYVFITHTHTHTWSHYYFYYTYNSSDSKRRPTKRRKKITRALYYSGRRIPLFISSIFFFFAPIFFFGFFAPSGLYFFCAYEYLLKIGKLERRAREEQFVSVETNACVRDEYSRRESKREDIKKRRTARCSRTRTRTPETPAWPPVPPLGPYLLFKRVRLYFCRQLENFFLILSRAPKKTSQS